MDAIEIFGQGHSLVAVVLTVAALGFVAYAFIDALRAPATSYTSAGKLTKNIWLLILGVALAANFAIFNALSIFGIVGVVAASVYMVDVRPAVQQGRGRRGGTNEGPYGPW